MRISIARQLVCCFSILVIQLSSSPRSQADDAPAVESQKLLKQFYDGEYQQCVKVVKSLLPKLEKPSKQHDVCLHVLGGSYYYLGRYDTAEPLLGKHVKMYPESEFKMASVYFHGSNLSRLQFWDEAKTLLKKFLENYPDPEKNIYMPFALYDLANCHYADDEFVSAIVLLDRLETKFPDSEILDMAYNLKGNVLQTQGNRESAEKYYKLSLDLAERRGNTIVAGEALYYLVGVLGADVDGNESDAQVKSAVSYYDRFWKSYGADSPYKTQMAVAGLPALTSVGRSEEGLGRLRGVISELAAGHGAFGLEEAINSYTRAYLKSHSFDELKAHFLDDPGIRKNNRSAQALFRIALIGAAEEEVARAERARAEKAKLRAQAIIKVLFAELHRDFKLSEFSNYILVRVGDHLAENSETPRAALLYYEEVLRRADPSYRVAALLGWADLHVQSDDPAELAKAITAFETVYTNSPDKRQKEKALYKMVTVHVKTKDWKAAKTRAEEYLDRKDYRSYAPAVLRLLARCHEELGDVSKAIKIYTDIFAIYAGYIETSAPSTERCMELMWSRNRSTDRQDAYEFGHRYRDITKHVVPRMKPHEKEQWKGVSDLVDRYEKDSSIKKAGAP